MFLMQAQDKLEIKIVMGGNPKEVEMLKFLNGLGPARLLACQLLPLLLGWIACCFRVIFGRKDWPTFKALIVVSVVLSSVSSGCTIFISFTAIVTFRQNQLTCAGSVTCL